MFFRRGTIGAMILILALGLAAALAGFIELSLDDLGPGDIGTKFLTLLFIALVIERSVEVYVNTLFAEREMKMRRGIRIARHKLDLMREAQENCGTVAMAASASPEAMSALAGTLNQTEDKLTQAQDELIRQKALAQQPLEAIRVEKARAAGAVSLVLSFGAAAVGVRVLGIFLPDAYAVLDALPGVPLGGGMVVADAPAPLVITRAQLILFRAYDVLLTALLLAGGADGIHKLLKTYLGTRNDLIPTT